MGKMKQQTLSVSEKIMKVLCGNKYIERKSIEITSLKNTEMKELSR